MDIKDAEATLLNDTHDPEGTFFRLRLGQDPGTDARKKLRVALRTIQSSYVNESELPRAIAYSCGIILHFSSECLSNLKSSVSTQEVLDSVADIEQGAFDLLAGKVANEWTVPRPDLGEMN